MGVSDLFNFDKAALSQMENIRRIGQRKLRNRAELDDFVQETLLRAYSKRRQLRDTEKFDRWIAAIARNLAREWNRKKREEPMEEPPELIDWRTPHDAVEEAERNRRLRRAMESLSPADRELLRARYMDEASYAELQAQHGLSYSAVALRIHRAKKRLRKILKSIGPALILVFGGFKRAAWGRVLLMSVTTKIVVGTAAALAVVVALWMLLSDGDAAKNEVADGDVQSSRLGDSPLRIEDQTPRVAPISKKEKEEKPDPVNSSEGAKAESKSAKAESKSANAPVELLSLDDAYGEAARLVGIEYDALIQVLPQPKAMDAAVNAVHDRVRNDQEYAYLRDALQKFAHQEGDRAIYDPRYPAWYDYHPLVLLVRSGRLPPEEMPHVKVSLPNGEMIRMLPHEKYIVKFRRKGREEPLTEEEIQRRDAVLQTLSDLQLRLRNASESEESLRSALMAAHEELQQYMTGTGESKRVHMWGREDDPNLKVYEIDLGIIE